MRPAVLILSAPAQPLGPEAHGLHAAAGSHRVYGLDSVEDRMVYAGSRRHPISYCQSSTSASRDGGTCCRAERGRAAAATPQGSRRGFADPLPRPKKVGVPTREVVSKLQMGISKLQDDDSKLENDESKLRNALSKLRNAESNLQNGNSKLQNGDLKLRNGHLKLRDRHLKLGNDHFRFMPEPPQLRLRWSVALIRVRQRVNAVWSSR